MNRRSALLVAVVVGLMGITGVAIAAVDTPSAPLSSDPSPRAKVARLSDLAVFASSRTVAENPAALKQMKLQAASMPDASAVSKLDYSTARDVSTDGLPAGSVWVAQADGGRQVCVLVKQFGSTNENAYSSGCGSLEEFNTAGLISFGKGPQGTSIFVSLQAPDVAPAVATAADGGKSELANADGLTVARLSGDQRVSVGGSSVSTSALKLP